VPIYAASVAATFALAVSIRWPDDRLNSLIVLGGVATVVLLAGALASTTARTVLKEAMNILTSKSARRY
jgi:hypothetical protein